ncbi:MAG: hypothetical protein ACOX0U_09305 [Oscillospiraceae bacterium]
MFMRSAPLIIFNGDFNLTQHLLIGVADRCTEKTHGSRGIKIEDAQKILMLKIFFRRKPAAGHEGIGDADGYSVSELDSDIVLIILFQKTTVNDVDEVSLVVLPIFTRKLFGNILKLALYASIAAD